MDVDASEALNDTALNQLLCPVCMDYCKSPIQQCVNGHNTCKSCRKKLQKCALCKRPFSGVRNEFAEMLASYVKYPCIYQSTGCHLKFERRLMNDHLKACPVAIRCQMKKRSMNNTRYWVPCKWQGDDVALLTHLKARHKPNISKTSKVTHRLQLRRKTDVRMVQCNFQPFWSILTYEFDTHTLRAMVFLVGLAKEATQYEFKYELLSKTQKRAIVHQGDVVSVEEAKTNVMEYFDKFECGVGEEEDNTLLFSGRYVLKQFIDEGMLRCRLTVAKKRVN